MGQINPYFDGTVRGITETRVKDWASRRTTTAAARAVRRQKQPRTQLSIPSKEQFRAMMAAMRKPVTRDTTASADLTEGMVYSGMRPGEATELRWGDVSFDLKSFTVTEGNLAPKITNPARCRYSLRLSVYCLPCGNTCQPCHRRKTGCFKSVTLAK